MPGRRLGGLLRRTTVGAVAALLVGCGSSGGAPDSSEEIEQGRKLFRATCATCHGLEAQGIPQLGKDLRRNEFVRDRDVNELVTFFAEGRPASHPDNERRVDMPPKGGNPALTDEDLGKIAAYVKSLE